MKAAKFALAGQEYYLLFNGAAMFEVDESMGGANALFEAMRGQTKASFEITCAAAAILAEQGELARRMLGYDKGPILTKDMILALASPMEAAEMRNATTKAIIAGYKREVDDEDDVDLVLLELEQKKGKS